MQERGDKPGKGLNLGRFLQPFLCVDVLSSDQFGDVLVSRSGDVDVFSKGRLIFLRGVKLVLTHMLLIDALLRAQEAISAFRSSSRVLIMFGGFGRRGGFFPF